MATAHKFEVKRSQNNNGYVTCCGTEIVKVTKNQDPEMYGSVNWYYQDLNENIDDNPFYTLADIKKFLIKCHDNKFGTMEYTKMVLENAEKTLAQFSKAGN